ncbi:solute carrier family 25 member 35-like [Pollicipes pollicipes]|uniref:solute carrier family 25 member 35-like n=1 Tax=Pollicipes pollicipes TaxID=41117 RepID=UPI001884FFDD|nr:solute carrier family 25 member 35-like [Pollicipes pollicipes]
MVMNGIRLGTFHMLEDSGVMRTKNAVDPVKYVCGGALAGALGTYAASPLYMVKVHVQTQSQTIGVGHQHQHAGLVSALRGVHARHGLRGLWRGSLSSLPRVMIGSAAQLTTFSASLEYIERAQVLPAGSLLASLAASMLCGGAVVILMTPFDVIATRLYNQGVDASGRGLQYRGYGDCVLKILRSEGPRGFYKGVTANWLRVGPHSVLNMCFWTHLKTLYRRYERAPTADGV